MYIYRFYSDLQEHVWTLMTVMEDAIVLNVTIALMDDVDAHTFSKHIVSQINLHYVETIFLHSFLFIPLK